MKAHGFAAVLIVLVLLGTIGTIILAAEPTPIFDFTEQDTRREIPSAKSVNAQAGNITKMNINATVVTKTWQGYYGNVTGKIVLDSADNKSMYEWDIVSPEGEIYAANESMSEWNGIKCLNYSASYPELNLSGLEQNLDCRGDADCVNETFTSKNHPGFYVGSTHIAADTCWSTQSFVDDGSSQNFYEALLVEPTNNVVVYAAILNASQQGFDNGLTDFQMLVGENGHGSAATTKTPYYFYFELG